MNIAESITNFATSAQHLLTWSLTSTCMPVQGYGIGLAWRMRRDVTMQTICQVIMEKREGDGEMMQGTKEEKNGRKKKNGKMKINQ